MNARLKIIKAIKESGAGLERVQEKMAHEKEILLVLTHIDQGKSNALAKLCHAYHYSQQPDLSFEHLEVYHRLLDVNDYAAKEHGIAAEMVCLLCPQAAGTRSFPRA